MSELGKNSLNSALTSFLVITLGSLGPIKPISLFSAVIVTLLIGLPEASWKFWTKCDTIEVISIGFDKFEVTAWFPASTLTFEFIYLLSVLAPVSGIFPSFWYLCSNFQILASCVVFLIFNPFRYGRRASSAPPPP